MLVCSLTQKKCHFFDYQCYKINLDFVDCKPIKTALDTLILVYTQYTSTPGESQTQKFCDKKNSRKFTEIFCKNFFKKNSRKKVIPTFPKISTDKTFICSNLAQSRKTPFSFRPLNNRFNRQLCRANFLSESLPRFSPVVG